MMTETAQKELTLKEALEQSIKKDNGGKLILASHQPDFFPWMGYFYKIFQSDVFVFSDNVQYSKSGRHNYNQILTGNGPMKFTLPIHYHPVNLNELELAADEFVVEKMMKTLRQEYSKAAHYEEAYPFIESLLRTATKAGDLAFFNKTCILAFCDRFGLNDRVLFLTSSDLPLTKRRDPRIIEMCEYLGATAYYSGVAAKDYHIEEDYRAHGIDLIYSDYEPVVYPQVGKRSAINMCVIDYVMNCGFVLPQEWKRNAYDRKEETK